MHALVIWGMQEGNFLFCSSVAQDQTVSLLVPHKIRVNTHLHVDCSKLESPCQNRITVLKGLNINIHILNIKGLLFLNIN